MARRILPILFLIFSFKSPYLFAQTSCTTLGQNPSTAFPVCGTDTFSQVNVPICGIKLIPVPCNDGANYMDKNPFWYKFTCFATGTLGFLITPNDLGDDYDWQLFDITGHDPNDVYTMPSLFVVGNWSGDSGLTGASNAGNTQIECAGFGHPTFSKMPVLLQGHNYILLISHFTDSQSGYKLSFGGGTASITDTTAPKLSSAAATCDASILVIKLNKRMKCNTIAADGTDFKISPALANVVGAIGNGCAGGFDADTVTLQLSTALPPGNYTVTASNGSDGNTILDNCNRNIPVGDNVPLTVAPIQPTPMDSITAIGCSPNTLQLVFKKPIRCNSIASNGSDFSITGPFPVQVTGATGNCTNGVSSTIITIQLAAPIVHKGAYTITLTTGTDGNTIIDECGLQTPAGSSLNINAADTVSAAFTYNLLLGCKADTINFFHDGRNDVKSWTWTFDNSGISTLQNPQQIYTVFGQKQVTLVVSNGVCRDSAAASIVLDNTLKAIFETSGVVCPNDSALFIDHSVGNIVSWNWDFGNGVTSNLQAPPAQHYPNALTDQNYPVQLVVGNGSCFDSSQQQIKVVSNCYIAIPSAFTPNGDGLNDYLYPLNAYKADNLIFKVYNRFGQEVFSTTDWTKKWDGTINGKPQPTGTYVWFLQYTHHDTGKRIEMKGSTVLIR